MSTLKTTLSNEPINVIKGCAAILSEVDEGFSENIYSHHAIALIGDLINDAVSRLEETIDNNPLG